VQLVGVQAVRHGSGDGPPADSGRLPLRAALRPVCADGDLLTIDFSMWF